MQAKNSEQFGAAVRARRKELNVTQKDLAMTCGTGLRFIIDLEKGKPTCQIGKALRVLQALGLKLQIVSHDVGNGTDGDRDSDRDRDSDGSRE